MKNSKKLIVAVLIIFVMSSFKKHSNISEINSVDSNVTYLIKRENINSSVYESKNSKEFENCEFILKIKNQKAENQIGWKTIYFKKFTFELPENFIKQSHLSNLNKEVYQNKNTGSTIVLDIAPIPIGYENSTIKDIVPNLYDFGKNVNLENKKLFSDFMLLSTEYSTFANIESILVSQLSTKISGIINKSMIVKAHFILANPYYCVYTFSYPRLSFPDEQTIKRITNSFKFKDSQNKNIESVVSNDQNEPSLKESIDWLLSKLNNYVQLHKIEYTNYDEGKYKSVTTMSPFKIINGNLEINYRDQSYDPIIDEKIFRNFISAGLSTQYAKRQSNSGEYKLTRDESYKIEIPFNSISYNYYDKDKDYKGECSFSINTYKKDIFKYNLSKGTKEFVSNYQFKYDCSKEDDLGNRINKAIEHIKKLTPKKNTDKKEPF